MISPLLPRPIHARSLGRLHSAAVFVLLIVVVASALLAPARTGAQTMPPAGGTFQFDSSGYVVNESDGFAVVVISRLNGSTGAFTLRYRVVNGTAVDGVDYQGSTGTVTFADGDTEPKLISIPIFDDAVAEEPSFKRFTVVLTSPDGAATLGLPTVTTVFILDDDSISFVQFSAGAYTVFESDGTAVITVTRNPGTSSFFFVFVSYDTSDGTARAGVNYLPTSGFLSWDANDFTPRTFTVPLLPDGAPVDNLTVQLTLSDPSFSAGLGIPSQATLTIIDTDAPAVLQFSAPEYVVGEDSTAAVINVTRTGGVGNAVAVSFATEDGSAGSGARYQPVSGTVAWAAGDTTVKSIVVPLLNDSVPQRDETVTLRLGLIQGNAVIGPQGQATLIIRDDEGGASFPVVSIVATTTRASADGGTPGVFSIFRADGDLSSDLLVRYLVRGAAVNGVEYELLNGEALIPAGSDSVQITVRATNGGGIDGRDNVKLILRGDGHYFVGTPGRAKVRIVAAP